MVVPVVLDDETSRWEIEVGPSDESSCYVVEVPLDRRPRELRLQQEPSQPRLHRRLGRFGERGQALQPARSGATELRLVDEPQANGSIDGNERLDRGTPGTQIDKRAAHGRRGQV